MLFRQKISAFLSRLAKRFGGNSSYVRISGGGGYLPGEQYDYINNRQNIIDNTVGWFHVAADRIAKAGSFVDYSVYKWRRGGEKRMLMTDLIYDILDNPVGMSRQELFYRTLYDKRTIGNAAWYMPLNRFGLPAEIRYLHPAEGTLNPVTDNIGAVIGYKWHYGHGQVRDFAPNEIIHFKCPTNQSSVVGKAPSMYFQRVFDFDRKIKESINATMDNGVQLGTIFLFANQLNPEVKRAFELEINERKKGPTKTGQSYIVDGAGAGADVKTLQSGPREMDYLSAIREMRDQAMQANGIPKALIPSSDQTNRASAEADIYVWARFTLEPELQTLANEIHYGLIRQYDKEKFIEFDNVVPSDKLADAQVREILLRSGVPLDQLGETDVEGGETILIPRTLAPLERILDGSATQGITIGNNGVKEKWNQ